MESYKSGIDKHFCKGPDSKYFQLWGFVHTVSVATTQFCHYTMKAAIYNR